MRHENTLTCTPTPTPTPTRLTALLSPALPWRPLCGSCAHKTRAINTNNYTGKCNLAFMKWDRTRSWCHTWRSTTYGTVSSFIARVCCSSKRLFTGTENVHAPARYFFFFVLLKVGVGVVDFAKVRLEKPTDRKYVKYALYNEGYQFNPPTAAGGSRLCQSGLEFNLNILMSPQTTASSAVLQWSIINVLLFLLGLEENWRKSFNSKLKVSLKSAETET